MATFPVISVDAAAGDTAPQRHDDVIDLLREHAFEIAAHPEDATAPSWAEWLAGQPIQFDSSPAQMSESPTQFRLCLATPGFLAEELEVTLTPLTVTIEGNLRENHELNAGRRHFSELATRHTLRQFELPAPVDPDDLTATLSGGILTVTMQKANRT